MQARLSDYQPFALSGRTFVDPDPSNNLGYAIKKMTVKDQGIVLETIKTNGVGIESGEEKEVYRKDVLNFLEVIPTKSKLETESQSLPK